MPGRCLPHRFILILILSSICTPLPAAAQGTLADYRRADGLGDRLQGLVVDVAERPSWIGEANRFWYRKTRGRRAQLRSRRCRDPRPKAPPSIEP